jgi:hypothetical protein
MTFHEKVTGMMQRSGQSHRMCCKVLACRGGQAAARNKRRRKASVARERQLQEARNLE